MLNSIFKTKFPFAYNYFSNLLKFTQEGKRSFPQALIFEGADTKSQYLFALELARVLNCKKEAVFDCDCTNCKWIRTYSHPNVINVSQIHFKPEGDETKTVISVRQAREIEKVLSVTSDDHRFFIFFSSGEYDYDEDELKDFSALNYSNEINYSINPLNYQTFHPTTPNSLLKSIEEPPEKTTFIFLTKSKEDILPTIVSRCLVFKLSGQKERINYDNILNLFSNYPNLNYISAFEIANQFVELAKVEGIERLLNKLLEYLKDLLKTNYNPKIENDIKLISTALKHSRANMSDKVVLEALFLRMARGY